MNQSSKIISKLKCILTVTDTEQPDTAKRMNKSTLKFLFELSGKSTFGWQEYQYNQHSLYQKLVESFLESYRHHRPHMGLCMNPPSSTECWIFTETMSSKILSINSVCFSPPQQQACHLLDLEFSPSLVSSPYQNHFDFLVAPCPQSARPDHGSSAAADIAL